MQKSRLDQTTWTSLLLKLTASSLLNVIHPIAGSLTLLILGQANDIAGLAAFGVVNSVLSLVYGVFSFLPNLVTARVGKSVVRSALFLGAPRLLPDWLVAVAISALPE